MLDDAVDYIGFVDGEALFFIEVAVNYAVLDGLFHDVGGVQAIRSEADIAAALIEESPGVDVDCIGF